MKAFVLVGLPGSGKSTYRAQLKDQYPDAIVYSTDDYIDTIAEKFGKTYNEAFEPCIKSATWVAQSLLENAVTGRQDLIWDQTNLSVKKRKKIMDNLKGYDVTCVSFTCDDDVLAERLAGRPGKTIPDNVIAQMKSGYVEPTLAEGFAEIIKIHNGEIQ